MSINDIVFFDGDLQNFLLEVIDGIALPLNVPNDVIFDKATEFAIPAYNQEHSITFVT